MKYFVTLPSGKEHVVEIHEDATGAFAVVVDGHPSEAEAVAHGGSNAKGRVGRGATSVRIGATMVELWLEAEPPNVGVIANGRRFFAKVESERMRIQAAEKGGRGGEGTVKTPMPGRVVRVLVAEGEVVKQDQPVVVVEAMKMENELASACAGKVAKVHVVPGATVEGGATLVEIAPAAESAS
jgi:biotin carboxyl carrier protein